MCNFDDIDTDQLQLKSIDPVIPSNNTKCFYFHTDDAKYSDVHPNDYAPPGIRQRLMITLNMAHKARHKRIRCKIDSSSDGNLLTIQVYLSLFPQATKKLLQQSVNSNVSLYAYNGIEIQQLGRCKFRVSFKGQTTLCDFILQIGRLHCLVYLTQRT